MKPLLLYSEGYGPQLKETTPNRCGPQAKETTIFHILFNILSHYSRIGSGTINFGPNFVKPAFMDMIRKVMTVPGIKIKTKVELWRFSGFWSLHIIHIYHIYHIYHFILFFRQSGRRESSRREIGRAHV